LSFFLDDLTWNDSYTNVCILCFFDSRSTRANCDNATKVMCCQRYFQARTLNRAVPFDALFLSSPSEHFTFNALFLWEHSLCAPEGAELRLVRTIGMVKLNEILFETLSKKWH